MNIGISFIPIYIMPMCIIISCIGLDICIIYFTVHVLGERERIYIYIYIYIMHKIHFPNYFSYAYQEREKSKHPK